MKKLANSRWLLPAVLIFSIVGFALRLYTLGDGPDAVGLYASHPIAWCFLLILTFAAMALIILLSLPLKSSKLYRHNFGASLPGAIGYGLAALAFVLSAFRVMDESADLLGIVGLILGLGGAVCFALGAVDRYSGRQPRFWILLVPCLFLAVRLFLSCRLWSTVPQTGNYLLPFVASLFLPLAVWHLSAFALDIGNRHYSLFFSLSSIYLCIIALPGGGDPLFFLCMAAFLATNLCRTAALPAQNK